MNRIKNLKLAYSLVLISALIACSRDSDGETGSDVAGKVSWADELFSLPKPKNSEGLYIFGKKLATFFGHGGLTPSSSVSAKKKVFGKHFVKSVAEVDGLPREQGEKVLKDLLAPQSQACGGANCAAVFAVKDKEVPAFLDELLDAAGTSKELAKPDKKGLRKKIVGSLMPAKAVTNLSQPRDYIASIYKQAPMAEPVEPKSPMEIFSYEEISDRAGDKFIHFVFDYTSTSDYNFIRRVESSSRETLLKEGMSSWEINRWMASSNEIFEGMKKIPPVRGVVYRGMQDLTAADIAVWVKAWKEERPIGLGFGENPATTSASWSVDQAMKFLHGHMFFGGGSKYAVLLEISHHRGVAIERISKIPEEKEVLLPRDLKVTIESIVPMEDRQRTFIIKMRGVDSAQVILNQNLWIKRAA
jgi:hypothetical protein